MDDPINLLSVSVVVKDFDAKEPSFRVRAYSDPNAIDAHLQALTPGEGEMGMGGYLRIAAGQEPPYGATVYGLAIGKARAYPCISLSLDEADILKELDWWRDGYAPGIARFMKPAILEAPSPVRVASVLDAPLLAMAREAQAPESSEGFMAAWPRSSKWRGVRDAHLAKHPACEACGDKRLLNVHHVQPFHLFPDLELESSNLITLCEVPSHSCHFMIGHCGLWSAYNEHVREDAARMLDRIKNRRMT